MGLLQERQAEEVQQVSTLAQGQLLEDAGIFLTTVAVTGQFRFYQDE